MEAKTITIAIDGKEITLETGKVARQAGGSVVLRCGDTVILSTACAAKEPAPDIDFLPLRVDYIEKFSSAGKTLGGFIKREGRPTEKEILTDRLIDRPLRPIFEDGYFNEVQVLNYVLSYDESCQPQALAICAASAALTISDVPIKKPVAAVKVGLIDGDFIINPTLEQEKLSELDLFLAGTEDAILMIEGYCDFLTEEQLLEAVEEGHRAIKEFCQRLLEWQKVVGKEKALAHLTVPSEELLKEIEEKVGSKLLEAFHIEDKLKRESITDQIKKEAFEHFLPEGEEPKYPKAEFLIGYKKISSKIMRKMIFNENRRSDGRTCDEIRPIYIEQSVLPRAHGSSLFTRGETQALAVATLGPESMGQRYEDLDGEGLRSFYLQYSFPPFSVGEVGRFGPPGRREIGHGKLAEKALQAIIPSKETFPYTIRLESNITESNGSSSMASICGGCLSLMEAGVPISRPIAGIAMGLLLEDDKFSILSDILGVEDALGDMDFKIAGDEKGITAFQLDIKVEGITSKIMEVALMQAKQGRVHILKKMLNACPESSKHLSQYAPRIQTMQIAPSKIATVIGPGGKQIRAIVDQTGVDININDDGLISIASNDADSMDKAIAILVNLTADVEIGKTYKGKIVSIVNFGMFVKIFSKEGLCHISEIDHARVENVEDHFKEGDEVEVKVLEINDRGQIKLSRKALLPKPEKTESSKPSKPKENKAPQEIKILPPPVAK